MKCFSSAVFVRIVPLIALFAGGIIMLLLASQKQIFIGTLSGERPVVMQDGQNIVVLLSQERNGQSTTLPLTVEVAKSPSALEKGLSGRDRVPEQGLLFFLPERRIPTFWMKEMLFPIDMIWIDGETIVEITQDVPAPPPSVLLNDLPRYSPKVPADKVLEVQAGMSRTLNISVGDLVKISE